MDVTDKVAESSTYRVLEYAETAKITWSASSNAHAVSLLQLGIVLTYDDKEVLKMAKKQKLSPILNTVATYCCEGDIPKAYDYIHSQPHLSRREQQFAQRLHDRFFVANPKIPIPSRDAWIRNVIQVYHKYFIAVFNKRVSPEEGEAMLLAELNRYVSGDHLDVVEEKLSEIFRSKGYHFLGGITQPYWGPYIWKSQDQTLYEVEIPSGIEKLTVYFMKDFILTGWHSFASLGLASAGGWAKEEGLYCVYDRYKSIFGEPAFTISYLKHEAQHCADYRMFPELPPKDLEYRAKLVELIYYPTLDKLMDFVLQANPDRNNPHSYAAYMVLFHLSKQLLNLNHVEERRESWNDVGVSRIQDASRQLLQEHTEQLVTDQTGI